MLHIKYSFSSMIELCVFKRKLDDQIIATVCAKSAFSELLNVQHSVANISFYYNLNVT